MKKIRKSFTFWFLLLALFIIFMNYIGQDSKNIILIGCNPILNRLPYEVMNSGMQIDHPSVLGSISIYWYIASLLTMCFYGGCLDIIQILIRYIRHK